jgi:regulator of sigma E protease
MSVLWYIASFIVALGILIAVHEFGHFWVARRLGVKVLRFSIGFGKPIWKRVSKKDGTEYVIAAIPLGGYVRMLGEKDEDYDEKDADRAFSQKHVLKRMAIVFAGPFFNFLFAIFAFWLMYISGVPDRAPVLGVATAESRAARGGFQDGDLVLEMNGSTISSWQQFRLSLYEASLSDKSIKIVVRDRHRQIATRQLDTSGLKNVLEEKDLVGKLGFSFWSPPAQLGEIVPGSAADKAGLKQGDRILAVDGKPVNSWHQWVRSVFLAPGKTLNVQLQRSDKRLTVRLVPEARTRRGRKYGFAGVKLPEKYSKKLFVTVKYGPGAALGQGLRQTWQMSALMVKALVRMVTEVSTRSISGPLTIGKFAGESASRGWLQFLSFLAVISISLGVLNLLPIPVLDGGHLLYYLIEFVKGSPLSERGQILGQKIGIFLLLLLMGLAFYNDFVRFFA